jgi:hypothetical protein
MSLKSRLYLLILSVSVACTALAQQPSAPQAQTGTITGTVLDVNGGIVPAANVVLLGSSPADRQRTVANDNGSFQISHLYPEVTYHITVSASGFADWTSQDIVVKPGQFLVLPSIQLQIAAAVTTVKAVVSTEEIATEQLELAEKQRVLGFIPNFYVVYDKDPAPLTPKMKFRLAFKVMTDPITFLGSGFLAGIDQAADTPDYGQGWAAFGQRWGAHYVNGFTDIMVGGAILPSILHQDPRYFYMGPPHTKKARALHAAINPFVCRGDNGRLQPNYSSLGGYLASGAIANAYYPESNRGVGLVFSTFATDVAADVVNGLIQEFLLRKLTPSAKNRP